MDFQNAHKGHLLLDDGTVLGLFRIPLEKESEAVWTRELLAGRN